ncbi:MAG: hypothetical protein U9O94_00470 [Nanoarchaeota archaeon]|nr:hypothetical protein [Nanoarchaeota archaeon]
MKTNDKRPWYGTKVEQTDIKKNLFEEKRRRMIEAYNYWKHGIKPDDKLRKNRTGLRKPPNCS